MKNSRKSKVFTVIKERRAIRNFNTRYVPSSHIKSLVDAGRWAPCPNRLQPWKFVAVHRSNTLNRIVITCLEKESRKKNIGVSVFLNTAVRVLSNAGAAIYVFNTGIIKKKYKVLGRYYEKKAHIYEIQAIAAAIENMMLRAEECGLGTVWLGAPIFVNKQVEKIFKTNFELNAILALGYYDKKPERPPRLPVDSILEFNWTNL